MDELRVRNVMTHLVYTCSPATSLRQVATLLVQNRIGGAPVVEQGRLVGVISDADILRNRGAGVVADAMSMTPVSTSPEASLWTAADTMERRGFKRLPVVDEENYVIGIVTRSDLVRAMASFAQPSSQVEGRSNSAA